MASNLSSYGLKSSDELIGFEAASFLLGVGIGSIVLVVIFGFILCRMDMTGDHSHRSVGIYVEN